MAKTTFTFLSADGKTRIHGVSWTPRQEPKGVLQIAHGMVEYIERYEAFAEYMNGRGFAVVGHDHLGHGESVETPEDWGYFAPKNGSGILVEDMHKLRKLTQKKYPKLPYFMLGHSMGSFLLRRYLSVHGERLGGAVIMGTGTQPNLLLGFGKLLCRCMSGFRGWHFRSNLVQNMAFAGNNNKFRGENMQNSWLTKDVDIVKAYSASPKCTFIFTLNGFYNLFDTIQYVSFRKNIGRLPKDLPLFLVSGQEDPVGMFGKGVKKVYETYRKAGIRDITYKLYESDRHEILNELDRDQVYEDICLWIEKRMDS